MWYLGVLFFKLPLSGRGVGLSFDGFYKVLWCSWDIVVHEYCVAFFSVTSPCMKTFFKHLVDKVCFDSWELYLISSIRVLMY